MRVSALTYGGLKNCSNTTYIPRTISVIKNMRPALSNADSPSSQFGVRPVRYPGGGACGVAYLRTVVVENRARGVEGVGGKPCMDFEAAKNMREGRAAIVPKDRIDAMMGKSEWRVIISIIPRERGRLSARELGTGDDKRCSEARGGRSSNLVDCGGGRIHFAE